MPRGVRHRPTEKTRDQVKLLAAVGVRHEDIALKLEISADTLKRHYSPELDSGRIDANARVAQTLFQQAIAGNITAMIFWLKTRAGWRESSPTEPSAEPPGGPAGVSVYLPDNGRTA